ncbi:MAG: tRNA (adenosine(37)-N6)-threonylcarbamoyltransferase complex ATPase subunit type 1 TsaE [Phycisphaerae bacterium]|nr:tRNA (adenosine(37)-N6)-threonylcarbamoyltransferase complex ATPase subunit type 1 TsaE [Phycisphaerae bacterium]
MTTAVKKIFDCENLAATEQLGRRIGAALCHGDVLAMIGPLGSGKTTLTKGIAAGAGVRNLRQVNSPTFVIVNEYEAVQASEAEPLHIYHIDVYRLRGSDDLDAIGFDEMIQNGAVIIEWADRVADLLPEHTTTITIEPTGEQSRRIHCSDTHLLHRRENRAIE